MGCDSLKEATIVTADGEIVTVKDSDAPFSNKGKLFWALCGGGGGNFGVVVETKVEVHKLRDPRSVVAGRFNFEPEENDGGSFISAMNAFYTADWPEQMTIDTSWLMQREGKIGVRFLFYFDGNVQEFERTISNFIVHKGLRKQFLRRSLHEKSTRFLHETLVAQWEEETRRSLPAINLWQIHSSFVLENDSNTIVSVTAIIKEELDRFGELFKKEEAEAQVSFIHSGGQATKKSRTATAFPWRAGVFHTSFINFPDRSLPKAEYEKAYYGNNHQKLQKVKQIWDKDNYFKWDQSINLPNKATVFNSSSGSVTMPEFHGPPEEDLSDVESINEEALTDLKAGQQWEHQNLPTGGDWPGLTMDTIIGRYALTTNLGPSWQM
ncbi:hypothetical protein LSUE1_G000225 [Lachnellula suecica]|uniref:Berberine/berberine-like domain-containing protein n=1 Tax=Lachnellula suecica TaxID=602035 RepID=A0A8T9CJ95_9HELO|nr:hypothetical protein LSUE1_G000225 [Lachnellula suecica]